MNIDLVLKLGYSYYGFAFSEDNEENEVRKSEIETPADHRSLDNAADASIDASASRNVRNHEHQASVSDASGVPLFAST